MMKYLLGFLILYFLFTSGFVFEITQSTVTDAVDVPYSYNFSGYRTGVVGIFSRDDIKAAEWISGKTDQLMIATDYNGRLLIAGYLSVVPTLSKSVFDYPVLSDLEYYGPHFYYFRTEWMTLNNKYVEANNNSKRSRVGLRDVRSLPDFNGYDSLLVFRTGDTSIYEVTKKDAN